MERAGSVIYAQHIVILIVSVDLFLTSEAFQHMWVLNWRTVQFSILMVCVSFMG